jgi:plastocyanin domain-containing protein
MPKSGARKVVKPVAATVGIVATMASIWWFALKPRRKAKAEAEAEAKKN